MAVIWRRRTKGWQFAGLITGRGSVPLPISRRRYRLLTEPGTWTRYSPSLPNSAIPGKPFESLLFLLIPTVDCSLEQGQVNVGGLQVPKGRRRDQGAQGA